MSLNYCMQTYSCPQYWALPNFPTTDSVNCQTAVRLVWAFPKSKMFIPCAKDVMFRRIWKVSIYFWGNIWTVLFRLSHLAKRFPYTSICSCQILLHHLSSEHGMNIFAFYYNCENSMYIPSASFAILSMSAGYLSMPWLTLFHCG